MTTTLTLDREAAIAKLCELAADIAGLEPGGIGPDTHLRQDLNFDSLDDVEFMMKIEEEFDVNVPDEQAETVRTIRDAANLPVPPTP